MDTSPMPLDELAATHGGLGDFRIVLRSEIVAMLRQLADGSTSLNLNAPDGQVLPATVWAVAADRDILSLAIDPDDPRVDAFVESNEAVAVGYIDNIKLQFDVNDLVLVRGSRGAALNCALPVEIYRFQRRAGYRVRPAGRGQSPVATMRHPSIPDMQVALRVLDVSIGGCALFMPSDVPPLVPGVLMNGAHLELDTETRIAVALRVQHVTSLNPDSNGVRLGCEMVDATGAALRSLQRYIEQTQKRRRFMTLG
jgi:c-di-GMP-binding flagellar brake protein YcgR